MSNGNVSGEHSLNFSTATVGIFSHDMKKTLLVCNDTIRALVPPGGKSESTDINIYHTGLRELWEEVGIDMVVTTGDWLDEQGGISQYQKIVRVHPFQLGTQAMLDYLFLYRLRLGNNAEMYSAEKEGRWYAKKDLEPETITLRDKTYQILVPGTRDTILSLLQ